MLGREAISPFFGLRTASDPLTPSKSTTLSVTWLTPRAWLAAMLVALAYYAGSQLAFFLKPGGTAIATFWPPSAILLAAFLLAPKRIWWIFLVTVIPAHLIVQLPGTSLSTTLGWFIANTGGPVLGAAIIRRTKKKNALFDSLQGITVFLLFGVLLPPLVKALLNALVTLQVGRESNYWMLWMSRLSSNVISNLILVPIIVIAIRSGVSWFRNARLARFFEVFVLTVGLVVVSFVLGRETTASMILFILAPLPFLLWAAIRFGSGGLSASLLVVALISIWNIVHGHGPFESVIPGVLGQQVILLHSLLTVLGIPLILTAALIAERHRDKNTLRKARESLIDVEEQESRRIARELHTDIAGQLTLTGLALDRFRIEYHASAKQSLDQVCNEISRICGETVSLSHELHPFTIEYLGLSGALKKLCCDTGAHNRLTTNCLIADLPFHLPSVIERRIFHVAQLALQNAQRRKAKNATVKLTVGSGQILLRVDDDGLGLDPQRGEDVAMTYMQELLLSVGGTLEITPCPPGGIIIEAAAPFSEIQKPEI